MKNDASRFVDIFVDEDGAVGTVIGANSDVLVTGVCEVDVLGDVVDTEVFRTEQTRRYQHLKLHQTWNSTTWHLYLLLPPIFQRPHDTLVLGKHDGPVDVLSVEVHPNYQFQVTCDRKVDFRT